MTDDAMVEKSGGWTIYPSAGSGFPWRASYVSLADLVEHLHGYAPLRTVVTGHQHTGFIHSTWVCLMKVSEPGRAVRQYRSTLCSDKDCPGRRLEGEEILRGFIRMFGSAGWQTADQRHRLNPVEGKREKNEGREQEEDDVDQRDDLDTRLLAGTKLIRGLP